jgi:hypothetical protein
MKETSEKDKQAVKLRAKGHTFEHIARKLEYENADAAREAVYAVLRVAEVISIFSVDGADNSIYEINIRLTTTGGDPRVPFRVRQLLDALYDVEAKWEQEMTPDENMNGPILQEPTTFSVSKVVVNNAPQTGKSVIFPEV